MQAFILETVVTASSDYISDCIPVAPCVWGELRDLRHSEAAPTTGALSPQGSDGQRLRGAQVPSTERLLIVHGHWCYSRLANMVL